MIATQTLRVDSVGSFLRPPELKEAFQCHDRGEIDDAAFKAIQDTAIRELVRQEEAHGLPFVGDGEFRRRNFNQSFGAVAGMEPWAARLDGSHTLPQEGVEAAGLKRDVGNEFRLPVTGPLRLVKSVPLDEYRFVAGISKKPATVTLLSVDRISMRYAYEESPQFYADIDTFADAVSGVEQQMVRELGAAGCTYVHIDAPSYTAYVDEESLGRMRARGEDPQRNITRSIAADNAVVSALPGATFGIHLDYLQRRTSRERDVLRTNPYWHGYQRFVERLAEGLAHRTIRAWHYTRLTDAEVDRLLAIGIHLSTIEATRGRLDAQVAAALISHDTASAIFEKSPLHDPQQLQSRANRFWMTSHPIDVTDMDVTLLLNNWGGEVVYFWLDMHPHLEEAVGRIGRPRVLEVAVPLDATRHAYDASKAVIATFARTLGCIPDFGSFDLCVTRPLGPESIIAVHTAGQATFDQIGMGYPRGYSLPGG